MAVYFWQSKNGDWTDPTAWAPQGTPATGDTDLIEGGTATLNGIGIDQTVVLDSVQTNNPATLVLNGSGLAPGSYVVTSGVANAANLTFQNAALQGNIYASYGATIMSIAQGYSAQNYGAIGVSSLNAASNLLVSDYGNFVNYGLIDAALHGTINITVGAGLTSTQLVVINAGALRADGGGSVAVTSVPGGGLVNVGQIIVDSGRLTVNTALFNQGAGQVSVSNGGTLALNGATTGSTIQIQSGMLEFGEQPALQFTSTLAFTGSSATLQFDNATISEQFSQAAKQLSVAINYNDGKATQAVLQLDAAHAYSAADFAVVNGNQIAFTAHPPTV